MVKKITLVLLVIVMFFSLSGCNIDKLNNKEKETVNINNESKIKVIVSFEPLKKLVKAIGKDKVDVKTVIPLGVEPHKFQPKVKDLESITKSKIFIYNGLGMENWIDKVLNVMDDENILIVEASKSCQPIKNLKDEKQHRQFDPHIWLSLKMAKIETNNIKEALIKADPSNKRYYEENYDKFSLEIDKLYNSYKEKFSFLKNKNFVTGHAAFGYLCRDFGLTQKSIANVFAEGEPSVKKMKELTEYCKSNNIKTIFVEEMVSTKTSETLAKEVGAKVQRIYTLTEKQSDKGYIEIMKDNLERIYNSMK